MWSFAEYKEDDRVDIIFNKTAVLELEGKDASNFKSAIKLLKEASKLSEHTIEDYNNALQNLIESYHTMRESECSICRQKFYKCMVDDTCGKTEPILH